MKRNQNERLYEKREKEIERLSRKNRFYAYERFKKTPDPTLTYGVWIKTLAREVKI